MLQGNVMQLQLPFDFVKINFGIVMIRSLTVMIIVSTDASRCTRRGARCHAAATATFDKSFMCCEGTILALTIKESDKIHILKMASLDTTYNI
jgi:hypothetical protein